MKKFEISVENKNVLVAVVEFKNNTGRRMTLSAAKEIVRDTLTPIIGEIAEIHCNNNNCWEIYQSVEVVKCHED